MNRARVLNVTADVDPEQANANRIVSDLPSDVLPSLLCGYPSLRYSLAGQQQEQAGTLGGLGRGFLYALSQSMCCWRFRSGRMSSRSSSWLPFPSASSVLRYLALGVLFATVITLFLIPAAYMILEDSGRRVHRTAGAGRGRETPLEPWG